MSVLYSTNDFVVAEYETVYIYIKDVTDSRLLLHLAGERFFFQITLTRSSLDITEI